LDETVSRETQIFRSNLGARVGHCVDIIGKKSGAATVVGVSSEQLNKWIKGTVKVPVEALRLLAEASSVDFSWLATGAGVPPSNRPIQVRALVVDGRQVAERPTEADQLIDANSKTELFKSFIHLPMYEGVSASAGSGALPIGEHANGVLAFERQFLRDRGANPDSCTVIKARGDSMTPTIPDGSLLVVDHSQREVANGYITVIGIGDDLLVKRIRRRLDGMVELISDNPAYAPEVIGAERLSQLRIVGRVIYFCRVP
jgi:phage repressor protein C with HTH and peptisase S24 domain